VTPCSPVEVNGRLGWKVCQAKYQKESGCRHLCLPSPLCWCFFFIRIVGEVESKLGPLGTSATKWPIIPAPGKMENLVEWRLAGETEVLGENLPGATLSTTNPTWPDPGSNPGRRGGKPATNRLSYGAALCWGLVLPYFSPTRWRLYVPSKNRLIFTGLYPRR
jgi:hypothetical protein